MTGPTIHSINTPTVTCSHLEELGHQKVGLASHELTKSFTRGFLAGLVLNRVFHSSSSCQRRTAYVAIGSAFAADTFVSDYAKEISYQHEFAREVWEHEFNPLGEVDEYISYALSKGLTAERAKEIGTMITSEPAVSVPYHLAFELDLLEPGLYQKKLKHCSLVTAGFVTGSLVSEAACLLFKRLISGDNKFHGPVSVVVCCAALLPVMGIRYKHIGKVAGSDNFKILAGVTLTCIIGGVLSLGKLFK